MDNIDKTMKFDYEEIPKDNVETVLNNVHERRAWLQCCKSNCRIFTLR